MNVGRKSGVVCRNINSFDQWGVELGKVLATDARGLIAAGRCASPTTQLYVAIGSVRMISRKPC